MMTIEQASLPPSFAPDHPLSPRGRFARLAYLAWYLVISLAGTLAIFGAGFIFGMLDMLWTEQTGQLTSLSLLGFAIFYVVLFYYMMVIMIRRLHDLNQTGWLALLLLVPVVNLFFMLYLMFGRGTAGANQYGPQRLNRPWEAILGRIYIVLVILTIVAMLSLMIMWGSWSQEAVSLSQGMIKTT